jgi:hypothetical protein
MMVQILHHVVWDFFYPLILYSGFVFAKLFIRFGLRVIPLACPAFFAGEGWTPKVDGVGEKVQRKKCSIINLPLPAGRCSNASP